LTSQGRQIPAGVTAAAFAICAVALLAIGLGNAWAGSAIHRRQPAGRLAALGLAIPNLFVLPFGTALGIYAMWVLLHDETRKMFVKVKMQGTRTAIGLDENLAGALAYALGWVTGAALLITE